MIHESYLECKMTARSWSRLGLVGFCGGILAIAAIRILHPYFITAEALASRDALRRHLDVWLLLGAVSLGICLGGLIVWITGGVLSRKEKNGKAKL
ncbi:MAG: hypothetical protein U1F77_15620 [Kiritimatiellia bacterium]